MSDALLNRMHEAQDEFNNATGRYMGPDQLYDRTIEEARSMGLDVEALVDDGTIEQIADEAWVPN